MKSKAAPAKGRRSGQTQAQRARSTTTEPMIEDLAEVERPLDAEDIALASLEAQVRAAEARADLGVTQADADVSVRLPRAVISRLESEAGKRCITPSELIKRALMKYLGI